MGADEFVPRPIHSNSFSRTYTMFGFLVGTLAITQFVVGEYKLVIIVVVLTGTYYFTECKLRSVMKKMATSSSYFRRIPFNLIPYGFFTLSVAIGGLFAILKFDWECDTFIKTYLYELFFSLTIFLFSTSFKCFTLGTGAITYKLTRRGFFGVCQRIFILIRGYFVMPKWIEYFNGETFPSFLSYLTSNKSIYLLAYFVMKCFIQLYLLWEIGNTLKNYSVNAKSAFKPLNKPLTDEECVICQDIPEEPVMLTCGHVFCYKCVYRWSREHNTCPTCRAEMMKLNEIEFADGFIPNSVLFSAF
ncbi:RING/U-box superfamily protein [Histomonas meleagridis]|uniref:RING/U-box superfamily protein n=1 Tax=Histomonas meleagridis TaxID=135588 RepID=UPI003559D166|nr:RING/U-box superfamily protein [Histomonas meleagridis]KAH0802587.1 RING/U-box superfamily protein [Histomonas meleagridis]